MHSLRPLILLLALFAAAPAAAAGFQNLEALEFRLVSALGAGIGQPGGPAASIDRRLKLLSCAEPTLIAPPVAGAVAIRCASAGWRIRVPLVRDGSAPAAPTAAPVRLAAATKQPPVIRRGDPVELRAEAAGFSVSNEMIADGDGAPGDRIRVRADRQSPPVMVEVVAAGLVRIPG